jgi:hypothetical protein
MSNRRSTWTVRSCGCRYWRHAKRKLCKHDVRKILRLTRRESLVNIAAQFRIHPTGISHIKAGRYWRAA